MKRQACARRWSIEQNAQQVSKVPVFQSSEEHIMNVIPQEWMQQRT